MAVWDDVVGFFKDAYSNVSVASDIADNKFEKYRVDAERVGTRQGYDFKKGGLNDEADAFRHVYSSAQATREFGEVPARIAGVMHEIKNLLQGGSVSESVMDHFNNGVGQVLAQRAVEEKWTSDKLGEEVRKAIKDGKAKTQPVSSATESILDYYR